MKMEHLFNGKISIAEYLATFRQTAVRHNAWQALFYLSIFVVLYSMWTGPFSFMMQNLFISLLVWWVDRLEKELTRRGPKK